MAKNGNMSGFTAPSGGDDQGEPSQDGCELEQLGNVEVFYCPVHTGMGRVGTKVAVEIQHGVLDPELNEMVDSQMNKQTGGGA